MVKTTKVVEETVEVQIIGSQSQEDPTQPKVVEEVNKIREEQTETTTLKSIPVEGDSEPQDDQKTETQEPEFPLEEPKLDKISTPPREEAPAQPRKRGRPKSARNEAQEKDTTMTKKPRKEGGERQTRRGRRGVGGGREGYKRYVFRVLKQVHPGMGISSKAMTVVNNLMSDMFERLAMEASGLNMYGKKSTMTSREIQGAVKLILPGELGKHAIAEGSKAVTNYMAYDKK